MSLEARLQTATAEYKKLGADLANAVAARQKLDSQLSENAQVKEEFAQLKSSNTIYKLVGPVLVQQDPGEAKANVETRLEYIRGEINRVENQLKDLGSKCEQKNGEVVALQTAYQRQQSEQQPASLPSPVPA